MVKKYNPFRPNSMVTPGMFCGRFNELERIERSLFQTKNGNPSHFLIEGERGIGKSSLFLYVDYLATGVIPGSSSETFNFVVVSIELRTDCDYYDLIRIIGSGLRQALSDQETIKKLAVKAWDFLSNWEILGVQYHKVKERLEPHELLDNLTEILVEILVDASTEVDGILILIDEADKPDEAANLGELVKLLTERLTRRRCERVCLGLAGLPNIIPKLRHSHESAPRVFTALTLEPLEPEERVEVIRRGLKEAKEKNGHETKITPEAEEMISHLSEGYPHFIQEFAYWAFDHDEDGVIDAKDVLESAYLKENSALQQLGQKYFRDLYFDRISSDDYRQVLNVMADHSDGWVSRAEILKTPGIKESTVNNALAALKKKNIIIPSDRHRGEYKLPTKSFAAWIKALATAIDQAGNNNEPELGLAVKE